ncbi:MAG: ketoacyl-ACP synthase III [Deltaproteobacteria bacterium]|nr:MAG: ketoacyl-ACP synthase III [Deltaproteobacteria bacterium]
MARTCILGTGIATGEHLVKNEQLAKMMDTSDEWIRERSGVEQRYYVETGTATSDLGVRAAKAALEDAGVTKDEIDYVVFATMTPDYYFPGCGGLLQHKLGLRTIPSLDIRQQCTGFLYGLQVSDALLQAGQARTLLLVGAEVHSGFMPWTSWDYLFGRGGEPPSAAERAWITRFRDRTVLFGDAGGALVLRLQEGDRGVLGFKLYSDGESFRDLYVPSVGFAQRPYVTPEDLGSGRHIPEMNGRSVFKMAVTRMPEAIRELCKEKGISVSEIDLLVAHQANLRINEAVQKALGLPDEKVFNNIQRYGNTTAATIPIALHEARKADRVKPGTLVAFAGLGSGFHWGAALLRA